MLNSQIRNESSCRYAAKDASLIARKILRAERPELDDRAQHDVLRLVAPNDRPLPVRFTDGATFALLLRRELRSPSTLTASAAPLVVLVRLALETRELQLSHGADHENLEHANLNMS
ncbi:MAG TPA: hypothetical protein VGC41_00045 [Kofleriaceae bacterium]